MPSIYELHKKAFSRVSAFVILEQGERVATVAIKFPADGAGRLWAYFHLIGGPRVRGFAGGYGYDKRSAAVADAIGKILRHVDACAEYAEAFNARRARLQAYTGAMDSLDWKEAVRAAGFKVLQAV